MEGVSNLVVQIADLATIVGEPPPEKVDGLLDPLWVAHLYWRLSDSDLLTNVISAIRLRQPTRIG
ncbi:hypothetical protein [Bradyrhizobium sp. 170]|uniref:hypothetical protein n=1 Tax=Bradyrhizobium sp. 170 TaxID=2782641 RepID=UPI001FFE7446|nr:hypothetical protein [Bradyrhizobium sp. 170]